jgi:PTH1 family peptidyl-tRNA hydrolase
MNLSGKTLKPLLARYPLDPETAHFILYDHLEFPASKVGVRKGGSAGGQNGMRSCLEVLGKKNQGEVWQVRIGIDRPPGVRATLTLPSYSSNVGDSFSFL